MIATTTYRRNDVALLGVGKFAEIMRVSRQRALEITREPDFPAPVAVLTAGQRIWDVQDVHAWVAAAHEQGRRFRAFNGGR